MIENLEKKKVIKEMYHTSELKQVKETIKLKHGGNLKIGMC